MYAVYSVFAEVNQSFQRDSGESEFFGLIIGFLSNTVNTPEIFLVFPVFLISLYM